MKYSIISAMLLATLSSAKPVHPRGTALKQDTLVHFNYEVAHRVWAETTPEREGLEIQESEELSASNNLGEILFKELGDVRTFTWANDTKNYSPQEVSQYTYPRPAWR